jgi:hypothetical protein
MKRASKLLAAIICFSGLGICCSFGPEARMPAPSVKSTRFGVAERIGHIEDPRLLECSGLEASLTVEDLFWAVNDSGNGPYLYALGSDGRGFGRVKVAGAQNRDWEALDAFLWKGRRPMILIADVGDNRAHYPVHTLYVVPEPAFNGTPYAASAEINVAWRIRFAYPDGKHDAEAVAVDTISQKVLVLTKRDDPPILFELPLIPPSTAAPVLAKKTGRVGHIPPPSAADLLLPYGTYRAQPTALDISPDRRSAVVLTYKHAYLFERGGAESWAAAFSAVPVLIPLPLPRQDTGLGQREAISFAADGRALYVTAEGRHAAIYRVPGQTK